MITTEDRDLQTRSQDSILKEREGELKKIQLIMLNNIININLCIIIL